MLLLCTAPFYRVNESSLFQQRRKYYIVQIRRFTLRIATFLLAPNVSAWFSQSSSRVAINHSMKRDTLRKHFLFFSFTCHFYDLTYDCNNIAICRDQRPSSHLYIFYYVMRTYIRILCTIQVSVVYLYFLQENIPLPSLLVITYN